MKTNNTISLTDIISGNEEESKKLEAIYQVQELEKTKREMLIRAAIKRSRK